MDTTLLLRVVARFKLVVAGGFVIALTLAFLSTARVSLNGGSPHVSYRKSEQWASYARILVAQPGFTVGSTFVPKNGGANATQALDTRSAADSRMTGLATIYASFVTSDEVLKLIQPHGVLRGELQSSVLPVGPNGGGLLPIVSIAALDDSKRTALALGDKATAALRTYVDQQQQQNGVPPDQRVQLIVLNKPGQLTLIKPRSTTLPIAVFIVALFASVALAFLLENLRPRPRLLAQPLLVPDAMPQTDAAS
jgi:hypothetical protein